MTTAECIQVWILIVTGVGVLVALCTSIRQSYLTRQQMKLNFFADYTKRYQEIILNFPENINESDFDYSRLDSSVKEKILRYMRAYFDLCSEEYYLSKAKRIEDSVWEEWKSGIEFTFSKTAFRDAWRIINLDSKFYSNFVNWINTEVL